MGDNTEYSAILFPSDGRAPSLVQLMTTPMAMAPGHHHSVHDIETRLPHPEVHMDYVAQGIGTRVWKYQLIEALDGMTKKFNNPYILFYPVVSCDGMPFPINKCIREIQGQLFREDMAWRGNIVVAKYHDSPFTDLVDASIADFPIIKNYLLTHGSPSV